MMNDDSGPSPPSLQRQLSDKGREHCDEAKYLPGGEVQVYFAPRREWVNSSVVAAGHPSKLRVPTYCVELYNGELLEDVPEGRLRSRPPLTCRFLASRDLESGSIRFKLATSTLYSPPLPQEGFPVPSLEPAPDASHGLEPRSMSEFVNAAISAAKRMVHAPKQEVRVSEPQSRTDDKPRSSKFQSRTENRSKYAVSNVEVVLQQNIIREWQKRLREVRSGTSSADVPMSSPVFAWHSTSWHSNLDKIAENGFLAPGDQDQTTGNTLRVANGAVYGPGVYTTPDIELTDCYGFNDVYGRRQALLCLVNMGHTDVLEEAYSDDGSLNLNRNNLTKGSSSTADAGEIFKGSHEFSWLDLEAGSDFDGQMRPYSPFDKVVSEDDKASLRKRFGGNLPSARKILEPPVYWKPRNHGMWQLGGKLDHGFKGNISLFGFNSRISPDRRQYVVPGNNQVLPVLLVTYEPRKPLGKRVQQLPLVAHLGSPTVRFLPLSDTPFPEAPSSSALRAAQQSKEDSASAGETDAERLWTVDVSTALNKNSASNNVHLMLVAEKEGSTVPVCESLMRELKEAPPANLSAVFFPRSYSNGSRTSVGHFGTVATPNALASLAQKNEVAHQPQSSSPLVDALALAVELCMRKHHNFSNERRLLASQEAEKTISAEYNQDSGPKSTPPTGPFLRDLPSNLSALALGLRPSKSLGAKLESLKHALRQIPEVKSQRTSECLVESVCGVITDGRGGVGILRVLMSSPFLAEPRFQEGAHLLEDSFRQRGVLAFDVKLSRSLKIISSSEGGKDGFRTVGLELIWTPPLEHVRESCRERFPLCSVEDRHAFVPLARLEPVAETQKVFGRYLNAKSSDDAIGAAALDDFFGSLDKMDSFRVSDVAFLALKAQGGGL